MLLSSAVSRQIGLGDGVLNVSRAAMIGHGYHTMLTQLGDKDPGFFTVSAQRAQSILKAAMRAGVKIIFASKAPNKKEVLSISFC